MGGRFLRYSLTHQLTVGGLFLPLLSLCSRFNRFHSIAFPPKHLQEGEGDLRLVSPVFLDTLVRGFVGVRGWRQGAVLRFVRCLQHPWPLPTECLVAPSHLPSPCLRQQKRFQTLPSVACCSVVSNSLQPPWTAACQTPLCSTTSWSLLTSTESVMLPNQLILGCPPLLLPSVFPSTRVFSSE